MKNRFHLPFVALVLAAPASLAAQSVRDFQLPPQPTPTATPRAQGPVDTESGVTIAPRVIATPTPTPTPTPAPAATSGPAGATAQPRTREGTVGTTTPAPRTQGPAAQPRVTPRPQPSALPTQAERLPLDPGETPPIVPVPPPVEDSAGSEREAAPVVSATATPAPAAGEAGDETANGWLLPALGGGLLALLGLGYLVSQRRRTVTPPEIERPVVGGATGLAAPRDIQLRAEAIKLTRSVMNATLHYRLTLINRSPSALSQVALGADIVSAHGGLPVEQQVATPAQALEQRHVFERIAPGQSVRYEGQITIPLSQARVIRQGKAALFVPLLRVRLDGASEEPVVQTFVIGLGATDGGRVMPFRIDEGPRSYAPIAARALD